MNGRAKSFRMQWPGRTRSSKHTHSADSLLSKSGRGDCGLRGTPPESVLGLGLCSEECRSSDNGTAPRIGEPPFLGSSLLGEGEQPLSEDEWLPALTSSTRPRSHRGAGILLKQLQHRQPHLGPVCRTPLDLGIPPPLEEATPQRVKAGCCTI